MSRPGRYIVIEGNDGTGKSTQVAMLADYFRARGHVVCVVEEPGSDDPEKSTPVANELRRIVKNGNLVRSSEINVALFSAARRELWREKIQPALQRGEIVLSARNYISTLAYQGYGDGLDTEEIIRMTKLFTDERYLQPDAMVVLTLSDAQRQQRGLGNPQQRTQRMDQAGRIKSHARDGTGGCRALSNGGGLGVPGWSLAFAVPTIWRTRGHHHTILYDRHRRRSS